MKKIPAPFLVLFFVCTPALATGIERILLGFVALAVAGVFFLSSWIIQSIIVIRIYRTTIWKSLFWSFMTHILPVLCSSVMFTVIVLIFNKVFSLSMRVSVVVLFLMMLALKMFLDWKFLTFCFDKQNKNVQISGFPLYIVIQLIPAVHLIIWIFWLESFLNSY